MSEAAEQTTPRPWRIKPYEYRKRGQSYRRNAAIIAEDGHWIATEICGHNLQGSSQANAALIVRAVNAHDALAEALTLALPYVESALEDQGYKPGVVDRMTKTIRAALKLAEV